MQQNKNIWDDSECTIEEKYTTIVRSKSPTPTLEFKNSLISNKGDISTARKISNLETVECSGKDYLSLGPIQNSISSLSQSLSSVSESQYDLSIEAYSLKSAKEHINEVSQKKTSSSLKSNKIDFRDMPSMEILKGLKNS